MKLIEKYIEINSFNFYQEELVIKKNNEKLFKGSEEFIFKGEPYCVLDNGSFSDAYEDKIDIYDIGFNLLTTINKKGVNAGGKIENTNYFSVDWEDVNGEDRVSIYDTTKELKVEGTCFFNFLNSQYKIVFDGYKIKSIKIYSDIIRNKFLWSYDLSEGYKIYGEIRLVKDVIFFESNTEYFKETKKIGLDVSSGKVLWELDYSNSKTDVNIADVLNKGDNKCYGYYQDVYQVFDPVSGKMLLDKDMSAYYNIGVSPTKNAIYDNRLWFVSGKGKDIKFGSLNIRTSEIEFIKDFPLTEKGQEDEQFDTPVYHNSKLYLRGIHYKTLYVFEEEFVK